MHTDKGIYCFVVEEQLKYIGRCTDNFKARINQGYGTIHPYNCLRDGQATNCHINSKINLCENVEIGIYAMTGAEDYEIKEMERLLIRGNNLPWNIQIN